MLKGLQSLKILALVLFAIGCAGTQINRSEAVQAAPGVAQEPLTQPNEKCYNSPNMRVLQILNDGILAYLCPVENSSSGLDLFNFCHLTGDVVFMKVKHSENDYVDDQKVSLPPDKCFVPDGTYTYATKYERKRVRKIKIMNSQLPVR